MVQSRSKRNERNKTLCLFATEVSPKTNPMRIAGTKKPTFVGLCHFQEESGGRGRIRTSDRLVRSQVLYPAELRVRSVIMHV